MPPSCIASIETPNPVTAIALAPGGTLVIGSEDGTARIYSLPLTKAQRAIMGLGDEISAVAFSLADSSSVWLAFGTRVARFDASGDRLVMKLADASQTHVLLTELDGESDVLNDIAISPTHLGYTSDSGIVGVLDLGTGVKKEMRTRHSSIAGSISFIPDRPNEMVSGGYDNHLFHFDFRQGTLLSRFDLGSSQVPVSGETNISLSPPFVTSLVVSSTGVVAAGTANGRLWMGFEGEKPSTATRTKKKRRYWEGLRGDSNSFWASVASQGPIVGAGFLSADQIVTCSLGGTLTSLLYSADREHLRNFDLTWTHDVTRIKKVNSMKTGSGPTGELWLVVGGIGENGTGYLEVLHSAVQDPAL